MLKRFILCGLLISSLLSPAYSLYPRTQPLVPAAQVTHPPIDEMSGIVKSRRYPDVYWVHNDSGDTARLFAIHANGGAVMPSYLSGEFYVDKEEGSKKPYGGVQVDLAANFDWEDITIDGDTLYVADTGNNGNARRDLGVYVLTEPNPAAVNRTRALKWLPVAYEDQTEFPGNRWHFDCEALFAFKGKLYFVSKHRANGQIGRPDVGANLYRMDTKHTDRMNILKKSDSRADLGGWVTGADLSPDGKTLAVVCEAPVKSVWLFEAKDGGDKFLSGRARRLLLPEGKQCEAVCFDGSDSLLVTNEQRDIFRLNVRDFTPVQP